MREAPVCKQVGSCIIPGSRNKVYIGNALRKSTKKKGSFSKLLSCKSFPYAGAKDNMG
jgi:hypothetical protein